MALSLSSLYPGAGGGAMGGAGGFPDIQQLIQQLQGGMAGGGAGGGMGIPGFDVMPLPDFAPGGPNQIAPRPAPGRPEMHPFLPPEVSQDPSQAAGAASGGVTPDQAMSWLASRPGGMPKWAADRGMEPEKYAAFVAGNPDSIGARQAARFAGGAGGAPMTKPVVPGSREGLTAGSGGVEGGTAGGGLPAGVARPVPRTPYQTSTVDAPAADANLPRSSAASGGANVRGGFSPPANLQSLLAQAVSGRGPKPTGQIGEVAPKRRVVRSGGKKIVA